MKFLNEVLVEFNFPKIYFLYSRNFHVIIFIHDYILNEIIFSKQMTLLTKIQCSFAYCSLLMLDVGQKWDVCMLMSDGLLLIA